MPDINSTESLMLWIMHHFAKKLENHAILKGGMVLRLLDCPRHTNDLDYVFIPFKSKKEILPLILDSLKELEGAKIATSMHSTSFRINIDYQGFKTQIESNVMQNCKTDSLSTISLAKPNNKLATIIKVMSLDISFSHKLAAWIERNLMRDLYDIYFFYSILDVMPDLNTLITRLNKLNIRRSKQKSAVKKMNLQDFLNRLEEKATLLNYNEVENELRDYLTHEELMGLDKKMKIGIKKFVDAMSNQL